MQIHRLLRACAASCSLACTIAASQIPTPADDTKLPPPPASPSTPGLGVDVAPATAAPAPAANLTDAGESPPIIEKDLWQRVRRGFVMAEMSSIQVQNQELWYAKIGRAHV